MAFFGPCFGHMVPLAGGARAGFWGGGGGGGERAVGSCVNFYGLLGSVFETSVPVTSGACAGISRRAAGPSRFPQGMNARSLERTAEIPNPRASGLFRCESGAPRDRRGLGPSAGW